jgi:hypothetical protein
VDKPPAIARSLTVRLHFAEVQGAKPGDRVFSVAIQGKEVLRDFDVVKAAGGPMRAIVKEFKGVQAGEDLEITLTPKTGQPALAAVEVLAED